MFLIVGPGRSATAAQYTSWRACQRRERSSAFVAHSKGPPPRSCAISPNRSACSRAPASVPWNSTSRSGVSGRDSFEYRLQAATCTSSSSSMRATGRPDWIVRMVASQAALIDGNGQMPAEIASGMPWRRSVISVMTPSVLPRADEQPREVVSAEDFRARRAVVTMSRSASRRSAPAPRPSSCRSGRRWCRGPRRGHAAERGVRPGSMGEEQAVSRRCSFSSLRVIPASTVQSRSSALTLTTRFIPLVSMETPTEGRVDVAFERGADPVGDDRHVALGTGAHHRLHLRRGGRVDHEVRAARRGPGELVGVLLAHRPPRRHALAQHRAQGLCEVRDRRLVRAGPHYRQRGRSWAAPGVRAFT